MSVKIMALVWEKDLPFNKAWVLMALADHANHEGGSVFPSLPLIAWKTGYSLPSIKRIVADLRDDEILIPYGRTRGGVVIYRIELAHVPTKPPLSEVAPGRPKGRRENVPRENPSQIKTPFCNTHNHHNTLKRSIKGDSDFLKGEGEGFVDEAPLCFVDET